MPASKAEILAQIEALAVHCRPPLMSVEQRELWLRDWCADLAEFPIEAIHSACRKWRHSGAIKFPTPGQLLPLVREGVPGPKGEKAEPWRPATQEEYAAMSLREKIREHRIQAHEARCKAGPMFKNHEGSTMGRPKGTHLPAEEMPSTWRRWTDEAERHDREAKRLTEILHRKQPMAAE